MGLCDGLSCFRGGLWALVMGFRLAGQDAGILSSATPKPRAAGSDGGFRRDVGCGGQDLRLQVSGQMFGRRRHDQAEEDAVFAPAIGQG